MCRSKRIFYTKSRYQDNATATTTYVNQLWSLLFLLSKVDVLRLVRPEKCWADFICNESHILEKCFHLYRKVTPKPVKNCSAMRCNAVPCGAMQCHAVPCSSMQCHAVQALFVFESQIQGRANLINIRNFLLSQESGHAKVSSKKSL